MTDFSKSWKSSKKPGKQRKYIFNAPLHTRSRFVTAKLSKELAKKTGIKRTGVRKGDKIKIVRGQFSGKAGKVNRVSLSKSKIYVDGIERTKTEGSKAFYPITPSNVLITDLSLEDKRRTKRAPKNEKQT